MNGAGYWQIVSVVAGCVTTAMTLLYSRERSQRLQRKPDRMEFLFKGYDDLLHQQQTDNDRKNALIGRLEETVEHLRQELDQAQVMIAQLRVEVITAEQQMTYLKSELATLRQTT